jgi:hypothetical protein
VTKWRAVLVPFDKRAIPVLVGDGVDERRLPPGRTVGGQRRIPDETSGRQSLAASIYTDWPLMRMRTFLLERAQDWEEHSRDRATLLRGSVLAQALEWLPQASGHPLRFPKPTRLQGEYILASEGERMRRLRATQFAAAGILLVLGTAGFVVAQRTAEARRADVARKAEEASRRLAEHQA